jgi:hypothetical protein
MPYPKQFLKGVPHERFIGSDDAPTSDLFYFLEEHQKTPRDDNCLEESINWRDDDGADKVLFDQTKDDGQFQFAGGIAILCRIELDHIIRKPLFRDCLGYERREISGNKYHGNLLLSQSVGKREMKKIAATIASMCFIEMVKNPNV